MFRILGLFLLTSVVGFAQTASNEEVHQGSYLYKSCHAAVRLMNSSTSVEAGDSIEESDFCLGYFTAFVDMNELQGHSSICLDNASEGTMIRVYVAYMDRNPKLMDELMILGVVSALHDGYPCHKATVSPKTPQK